MKGRMNKESKESRQIIEVKMSEPSQAKSTTEQ